MIKLISTRFRANANCQKKHADIPITTAAKHKALAMPYVSSKIALSQLPNVSFGSREECQIDRDLARAYSLRDNAGIYKYGKEMGECLESTKPDDATFCFDGALNAMREDELFSGAELEEKEVEIYKHLAPLNERRGDNSDYKPAPFSEKITNTLLTREEHYNNAEMTYNNILRYLLNEPKTDSQQREIAKINENIGDLCSKRLKIAIKQESSGISGKELIKVIRREQDTLNGAEMCYGSAIDISCRLNAPASKIASLFDKTADLLELSETKKESAQGVRDAAEEIRNKTDIGQEIINKRAKGIWFI